MIDANEYAIGRMAGEYVGQTIDKNSEPARVVLLSAPDYSFSEERTQGFLDGVRSEHPSVEVVADLPTGADRSASENEIAGLMRNDPGVDAIFSVTDSGAYGASTALEAAGVQQGNVIVVSVNAESLALDEVYNDGYLSASIDIARESGSQGALDAAVKLLGGGTLPEVLTLPSPTLITHDIISVQAPSE
jgi:ABC-type sugar transport system substrate-binding protein